MIRLILFIYHSKLISISKKHGCKARIYSKQLQQPLRKDSLQIYLPRFLWILLNFPFPNCKTIPAFPPQISQVEAEPNQALL